jgi:hypothetical protein
MLVILSVGAVALLLLIQVRECNLSDAPAQDRQHICTASILIMQSDA